MKSILIVFALVSLMTSSFAQSRINSMRCGGKVIREGDSKVYVISTCGKPLSEDVIAEEKSGIKIVELVFKVSGKTKVVTFRANKLIQISDM